MNMKLEVKKVASDSSVVLDILVEHGWNKKFCTESWTKDTTQCMN
jgi:hypothetical protein